MNFPKHLYIIASDTLKELSHYIDLSNVTVDEAIDLVKCSHFWELEHAAYVKTYNPFKVCRKHEATAMKCRFDVLVTQNLDFSYEKTWDIPESEFRAAFKIILNESYNYDHNTQRHLATRPMRRILGEGLDDSR